MPQNLKLATAVRNARADAITTYAGANALINLYSGTQPATANTALSGNTLLAQLTCGSTYAAAASGGVLTLNSITSDSNADATGTCSFFRHFQSNGTTVVMDGAAGTSASDLNLTGTTNITAGQTVSISSAVFTEGNA